MGQSVDDGTKDESDETSIENGSENSHDEDDADGESSVHESESADDEANSTVDPAFRQRVADALHISGGALLSDVDSIDSVEELEAWDDEQMLKVDEQLAEVFRQQAATAQRTDPKREILSY